MDIMMALLKIINNLVDVLKLDEPILEITGLNKYV
jgi:hypothetical protein